MGIQFEWDPQKAQANLKKHGISFEQAATVFGDPLALTFWDPDHSQGEQRFLTIGMAEERVLILVAHVDRRHRIRLISARKAIRRERKIYEEG